MGFLEAEESTGESLSTLILKRLEELSIPFEDCRGQSYDNGANMKGRLKESKPSFWEENPRTLFVPCGAHTVNHLCRCHLLLWPPAEGVHTVFCFYSAMVHVTTTLKSWSDRRWESRINSVEGVRYQNAEVRDALTEVRNNNQHQNNVKHSATP